MRICLFVMFLLMTGWSSTVAQVRSYAVEVSAVVQQSPPRIDFSWPRDLSADQYYVLRKSVTDTAWGDTLGILDGDATGFSDSDVFSGLQYEYSFRKSLSTIIDTVQVGSGTPMTFTIFDSWNDGMCCHHALGSYEVSCEGIVHASGGDFGSQESTSFVVGEPGKQTVDLIVTLVLDVYGQETTWVLTDDSTGQDVATGGPYQPPHFGHILAGIECPPVEDRGTIILLVAPELVEPLADRITRLEVDLIADGYRILRRDLIGSDTVPLIRDRIIADCLNDPSIETLFLLGNIPVPYSGNVMGAHTNHHGAWPADLYYGELDSEWTDFSVYNTTASRPANHNIPGDGKFDQTFIPSEIELQIGRVDLSDLPAFPFTELELMQRYLDKDHAFRTGEVPVQRRGLIDDNVGEALGLAFAAFGWRNFATMFGHENVFALEYTEALIERNYLWSYGCGPSGYTSCGGVVSTTNFANMDFKTIFTPLYGSYFGDWDNTNNVLRAPLASSSQPLVCFYAGRPTWHVHHMALGYPIGYSTRLVQNNNHLYTAADGGRQIHIALMGDPTLRMFIVKPAEDLGLEQQESGSVRVTWTPADDTVVGYHIYRTSELYGQFERINSSPVTANVFVDPAPLQGMNVYMVRALKLETSASGTFHNLSAGAIDSLFVTTTVPADTLPSRCQLNSCYPNPFNPQATISFSVDRQRHITIEVFDLSGNLVTTITNQEYGSGTYDVPWDGTDLAGQDVASGTYFVRLSGEGVVESSKIVLVR